MRRTLAAMRTTVEFEPDTVAAIEQLRRERGLGLGEAVNELIRRGLLPERTTTRFVQPTRPLGLRIDVSNGAEAIETLEGPEAR